MIYRVELRDREMDLITVLDGRIDDIRWGYSPNGGCDESSFRALSKYCNELALGMNYNVRIYVRNDTTKSYDLIYQGRIETIENMVDFSDEDIVISGFGYQSALSDIVINQTYSTTEISAIVKSILDNHVVPNTDITYDLADLESTGFTPTSVTFSYVSALDAIQKLAEIAGGVEWGVDKNRKLFFKQQISDIGFFFVLGKDISGFKISSTSRDMVNRVIVLGKDVSGSKFVYSKDYAKSQLKYGRRDKPIQNSAVSDNTTAENLADAEFAKANGGGVDRGSFILNKEMIIEESVPIPLFQLITREVNYDEKEYDTFLYADLQAFRIRNIKYSISSEGILSSQILFGQPLPDIVEKVKRLKYSLDNAIQSEA